MKSIFRKAHYTWLADFARGNPPLAMQLAIALRAENTAFKPARFLQRAGYPLAQAKEGEERIIAISNADTSRVGSAK